MKKTKYYFRRHPLKRILSGCMVCFLFSGFLSTKEITYFNYYKPTKPEMDELATSMKIGNCSRLIRNS